MRGRSRRPGVLRRTGLPGIGEGRGYIQAWWGQGNPIPERSAQRVLKIADQILKAGTQRVEMAA